MSETTNPKKRKLEGAGIELDPTKRGIENLIFQGGGIKGVAYSGALEAFSDKVPLSQILRVGGASAGAITALLLALNMETKDIKKLVSDLDFQKLLEQEDLEDKDWKDKGWTKLKAVLKLSDILAKVQKEKKEDLADVAIIHVVRWFEIYKEEKAGTVTKEEEKNIKEGLINGIFGIFSTIKKTPAALASYFTQNLFKRALDGIVGDLIPKEELFRKNYFDGSPSDLTRYYRATYHSMKTIYYTNGLYTGRELLKIFENEIEKVTGDRRCTFKDFEKKAKEKKKQVKELTVVALSLSTKLTNTFNVQRTPNVVVADAVRVSMSFPYFFKPYEVKISDGKEETPYEESFGGKAYTPVFVDGGVLDNYPTWLYDMEGGVRTFNLKTVGFKLVSKEQLSLFEDGDSGAPVTTFSTVGLVSYTKSLAGSLLGSEDNSHYHNGDRIRTVYIDNKGIETLNFAITEAQKKDLTEAGAAGVKKFFSRKS